MLGAAAGLFVAYTGHRGADRILRDGQTARSCSTCSTDWRLLVYAVGVTLATGVLTGVWPAVRAVRIEPQTAMKETEPRGRVTRLGLRRRVLVAGQVALSLALLVAAALFARTMVNLRARRSRLQIRAAC